MCVRQGRPIHVAIRSIGHGIMHTWVHVGVPVKQHLIVLSTMYMYRSNAVILNSYTIIPHC